MQCWKGSLAVAVLSWVRINTSRCSDNLVWFCICKVFRVAGFFFLIFFPRNCVCGGKLKCLMLLEAQYPPECFEITVLWDALVVFGFVSVLCSWRLWLHVQEGARLLISKCVLGIFCEYEQHRAAPKVGNKTEAALSAAGN